MTHERSRRTGSGSTVLFVIVVGMLGAAFGGYLLDAWVASAEFFGSLIR